MTSFTTRDVITLHQVQYMTSCTIYDIIHNTWCQSPCTRLRTWQHAPFMASFTNHHPWRHSQYVMSFTQNRPQTWRHAPYITIHGSMPQSPCVGPWRHYPHIMSVIVQHHSWYTMSSCHLSQKMTSFTRTQSHPPCIRSGWSSKPWSEPVKPLNKTVLESVRSTRSLRTGSSREPPHPSATEHKP